MPPSDDFRVQVVDGVRGETALTTSPAHAGQEVLIGSKSPLRDGFWVF